MIYLRHLSESIHQDFKEPIMALGVEAVSLGGKGVLMKKHKVVVVGLSL